VQERWGFYRAPVERAGASDGRFERAGEWVRSHWGLWNSREKGEAAFLWDRQMSCDIRWVAIFCAPWVRRSAGGRLSVP
jgi:hypothetical protein